MIKVSIFFLNKGFLRKDISNRKINSNFELNCAYAEKIEKNKKLAGILNKGGKNNLTPIITQKQTKNGNLTGDKETVNLFT